MVELSSLGWLQNGEDGAGARPGVRFGSRGKLEEEKGRLPRPRPRPRKYIVLFWPAMLCITTKLCCRTMTSVLLLFRTQNAAYAEAKRDMRMRTSTTSHMQPRLTRSSFIQTSIIQLQGSTMPKSLFLRVLSKFARHFASSSHKRFTESLKLSLCTSSSLKTCFEDTTEFQDGEQKEVIQL